MKEAAGKNRESSSYRDEVSLNTISHKAVSSFNRCITWVLENDITISSSDFATQVSKQGTKSRNGF